MCYRCSGQILQLITRQVIQFIVSFGACVCAVCCVNLHLSGICCCVHHIKYTNVQFCLIGLLLSVDNFTLDARIINYLPFSWPMS